MLGTKLNKQHLVNGFKKAKIVIGSAYHSSKNFLGNVDNGIKLFRTAYSVLKPAIAQYEGGGGHIANNVDKVLNGYDNIRSKALEAEGHIHNVRNTLAEKNIKFNCA